MCRAEKVFRAGKMCKADAPALIESALIESALIASK